MFDDKTQLRRWRELKGSKPSWEEWQRLLAKEDNDYTRTLQTWGECIARRRRAFDKLKGNSR